jgi:hypothetical protein
MMTEAQKNEKDWKALGEEILSGVFAALEKHEYSSYYKVGKTKMLKTGEIKVVLDESKALAAKVYDSKTKMIKRAHFMTEAFHSMALKKFHLKKL